MSATTPQNTVFVEEQHLVMRAPQVQFPIRQSDWEHLRSLLLRCKTRERNFSGAFWGAASIAVTALFSTFGFGLVPNVPEWVMRASIAVTVGSAVAAFVLRIVHHIFAAEKSGSVDDALLFMSECEQPFQSGGPPSQATIANSSVAGAV